MKNGDKVKIKDGSYMLTINDGVLSHSGKFESTKIIGWCKDTFTILDINGNYPADNENRPGFRNDTVISNDSNGEIWFCSIAVNLERIFIPCKAEETKFKVGQWVYWQYAGSDMIIRIVKIGLGRLWYESPELKIEKNVVAKNCRPATKEEIEAHLRKICDEKGYKKGMKVKDANDGLVSVITENEPEEYRPNYDSLVIRSSGIGNDYRVTNLYYNGKFAEIIPDLKKKPETKEEFKEFLLNWKYQEPDDFLNQYKW